MSGGGPGIVTAWYHSECVNKAPECLDDIPKTFAGNY